jgi:nicotinic acid phosphoribosyltransferase
LKKILPKGVEKEFFDFLAGLTTNDVKVYAVDEGMVVFPKVPLLRIEGPLAIVQLLETTLLNLVNYARLSINTPERLISVAFFYVADDIPIICFDLRLIITLVAEFSNYDALINMFWISFTDYSSGNKLLLASQHKQALLSFFLLTVCLLHALVLEA